MGEKEERVFSFCNLKNYISVTLLNVFIKGLGYTVITSYFTYFYTVFLGVSAASVAIVLSVGIVIDAISDFAMGAVIDMVYTKHGKAKHWMFLMAIPLGITMGMMFFAPENAGQTVKIIYAFVIYNLYCCCMTAVRIPSQSMCSLASDNDKVRTVFGWCSSAGSTLATTVTAAVLVPMIQHFGNGEESIYAYRMTLLVFSVLTAIVVFASGLLFHEKRDGSYWKEEKKRTVSIPGTQRLLSEMHNLVRNKYWLIYFVFHFFESWLPGIFGGTMAFFCAYVLGDPSTATILLATSSLPLLLGQIVVLPCIRFLDTVKVGLLGNIVVILGCTVGKLFGVSDMTLLCVGLSIRYFGIGMVNGCRGGMIPRIVDYGEWKFGIRQDGLVYSGNSVMDKVTSAMITLLLGAVFAVTGFSGQEVSSEAVGWIRFIFLDLPLAFACLSLISYLLFDLTQEKISEMRIEINNRKNGGEETNCENSKKVAHPFRLSRKKCQAGTVAMLQQSGAENFVEI